MEMCGEIVKVNLDEVIKRRRNYEGRINYEDKVL